MTMGESARCWQPTSPGRKLTLGSLRKRKGVLATLTTCRERRPLLPIGEIPPFHEPREHPASNIERPTSNDCPNWGRWAFDVGCWMLDALLLRFRGSMREPRVLGHSHPCPPHEPRSDRDGPLSLSLCPSEGESVPKAREGAVQGHKAQVPSGNSVPLEGREGEAPAAHGERDASQL